jgi:hypothetical protein
MHDSTVNAELSGCWLLKIRPFALSM